MLRGCLAATVVFLFATDTLPALACDPNEQCNRCLASAFNHCIQRGNDPICEARKKACQAGIAPPQLPNIQDVQRCLANLSQCPVNILARLGYESIRPIADNYIRFLQQQAGSNVYPLDEASINAIQHPAIYSVNLHAVRYATNINTIHGANITIGNTIYFVRNMNSGDPNDAWVLAHELEHVVQYANRGGVEPFLAEYVLKAGGSILRGGNSIDIHNNIDLENAANAKANQVMAAIGASANATPPPPQGGSTCQTNYGA